MEGLLYLGGSWYCIYCGKSPQLCAELKRASVMTCRLNSAPLTENWSVEKSFPCSTSSLFISCCNPFLHNLEWSLCPSLPNMFSLWALIVTEAWRLWVLLSSVCFGFFIVLSCMMEAFGSLSLGAMLRFSAVAVDFREAEAPASRSDDGSGGRTSWCAQPIAERLYCKPPLLNFYFLWGRIFWFCQQAFFLLRKK